MLLQFISSPHHCRSRIYVKLGIKPKRIIIILVGCAPNYVSTNGVLVSSVYVEWHIFVTSPSFKLIESSQKYTIEATGIYQLISSPPINHYTIVTSIHFLDQFFDANPLELFSKFHEFIFMVQMDGFSKDKEEFIIQVVELFN